MAALELLLNLLSYPNLTEMKGVHKSSGEIFRIKWQAWSDLERNTILPLSFCLLLLILFGYPRIPKFN